ncbi:hypothetical protein HK101_008205 [Irineochytrium annulatum]|nr:hypothetical protein HK101_008205 [Irineochytrium annulatum]
MIPPPCYPFPSTQFLDDPDLRSLSRTCRALLRLSRDEVLWRAIHARNIRRVDALLFSHNPQRPSRVDLAATHIMRGRALERRLSEGDYIGGSAAVRAYEAFVGMEKRSTVKALVKGLGGRMGMEELARKGLIPQEVGREGACSPTLVHKVVTLRRQMRSDALTRQLRSRISAEVLREMGVAKSKSHTVITYNPSLHPKAVELDRRLFEIKLVSKLVRRPSASILENMKVLPTNPATASMICPPIRSKVEYYEALMMIDDSSPPSSAASSPRGGNSPLLSSSPASTASSPLSVAGSPSELVAPRPVRHRSQSDVPPGSFYFRC